MVGQRPLVVLERVVGLGRFLGAAATGKPGTSGEYLPGVNPLADALVAALTGKSLSGRYLKPPGWAPGIAGQFIASTGQGLPQFNLVKEGVLGRGSPEGSPSSPRVYRHNPLDVWLRYLGVPHARVSPYALQRQRQRQDNPRP